MLLFILILAFVGTACLLAWFLIAHDHGEREPVAALWLAAVFGLVGAFIAAYLESKFISKSALTIGSPYGTMMVATLTVGLIEESCKFVPLALFIYRKRYFNENTDGIIYFALAGLGFGLPENILYTAQFGSKAGFSRMLLTPLFHAATTGTVGYFLAKRKMAKKSPFGAIIPLAALMVLHGLYDFGLLSGAALPTVISILITLGLSAGLFVLFLKANERDQDAGLSAVGHNSFCRTCGFANPKHHLYCTQCGNNA